MQLNFLTTMDYSPWSEREIWPFLKVAVSPKPERPAPTKIGVHAFDINPYLHEFFEANFDAIKFFDDHGL